MRHVLLAYVALLFVAGCGSGGAETGDSPICAPEEKKCDGSDVVKCSSSGDEWNFYKECANGCSDGSCLDQPPCTPSCGSSSCGDDGCGGSCGTCGGNEVCSDGQCCAPSCTMADGGKAECGPDGCGGFCGECPAAAPVCDKGICVASCTPDCTDKECGDDGCGGSCGSCPDAAPLCEQGKCEPVCKPNCSGKECGSDGCGGNCGECDAGEQCDKGVCECVPQCDGKDCGIDGCGGVCGKCSGQDACEDGKCVCQPACDGAECGPDGCGGTCGTCEPGAECVVDQCFCEPEADVACCGDSICWLDSCGDEGDVKESCAVGCENGECVLPQQVAVWIEEAILGVNDIEGKYWDIDQKVSKELVKEVSTLLKSSGNPWGSVAGFLLDLFSGPLMEHFEKPDPYGTAKIMLNGILAPEYDVPIPQQEDTYHPVWAGVGWSDLPVSGGLAIKLSLMDADFGFWNSDDPFGNVQIDKQEILDAMNNPSDPDKCWVDVSVESSQTVLLVKIAAYPTEAPCAPDCVGKVCGSDGCGGNCGVCLPGQACSEGACIGGIPDACNGISFEGCCVGNSLVWCEEGELTGGDCADYPSCGWSEETGYYNCGTDGSADPSGLFPLQCPPGTCPPKCEDKQCGDDGCGGSCGECAAGTECQNGLCVASGDECGGIPWEGCCAGTTLKYCENAELVTISCSQSPSCGWSSEGSFYDCGTAGAADPGGTFPKNCPACVPQCVGKECGDDGCGGSCGTCAGGEVCENGICVSQGGCGDVTYEGCCSGNVLQYCENGQIQTVDCSSQPQCGWDSQGGYYNCGTAGGSDPSGVHPKSCDSCVPNCAGKQCGSDGCGGSCGTCTGGKVCQNGTCVAQGGCGDVTYQGCCTGTILSYCDNGQLQTMNCASSPQCGWNSQGQFYDCGTAGGADPSGIYPKVCSSEPSGQIGEACTDDAQCLAGDLPGCLFDADGFPGGYCTTYCLSYGAGDCPPGSSCWGFEGEDFNLCLDDCGSDLDCRPGYSCSPDGYCFP